MGKNLISLLRKALLMSGIALPLLLAGCKKDPVKDPVITNTAPVVSVIVSQPTGNAPLTEHIEGIVTDKENNLTQVNLKVGDKVYSRTASFSLDTIFTNPGSFVITLEGIDAKGLKSTDTKTVNVYQGPYINQTATLDKVNINYVATLSQVPSAQLVITNTNNGTTFFTKDLTGNYTNLFTDVPAGTYKGELTAGSLKNEFTIVVPNYLPVLDASKISVTLPEYNLKAFAVSKFISDLNLLDRSNAKVRGANIVSGNGYVTFTDDSIVVRSRAPGNIQVGITYGSTQGGIATTVLNGAVTADPRPKIDLTAGFGNLKRYGSGDADRNNVFNALDKVRMVEIRNHVFSDPTDTMLPYIIDVTGDGTFDDADIAAAQIALDNNSYLLGDLSNPAQTRAEKVDWIRKMMAIVKPHKFPFPIDANCVQFADQLMLKSYQFSTEDKQKFAQVYPYDFTNAGFLGIRMCEVYQVDYDPSNVNQIGLGIGAHLFNGAFVGIANLVNNTYNINADADIPKNWCLVEPQFEGAVDIQPGQYYFKGVNAKITIRGPPNIRVDNNNRIMMREYKSFIIKNKAFTSNPISDLIITNDGYN